jgi:integrase
MMAVPALPRFDGLFKSAGTLNSGRRNTHAGIPKEKSHFHALKHTCGTLPLSEQHESIVDVQKHLGHADIRNTMIYAQLTDDANRERAERLRDWR